MNRLEIVNFAKPSASEIKKYKQFKEGEKKFGGIKNDIKRALVFGTASAIPGTAAFTIGLLAKNPETKMVLKSAGALGLLASIPLGAAGAAYIRHRTSPRRNYIKQFEEKYGKK